MDRTELAARQRPLRQAYLEDAGRARVPARAVAVLDGESVGVTLDTDQGQLRAGLHQATGGDGGDVCSADLLCQSLAACAGVTLRSVATARGIELREASVVVEAVWDARGTLGLSREVPVGITDVTVTFRFTSDADPATEARIVAIAERYCVIAQTLANPPPVTFTRG